MTYINTLIKKLKKREIFKVFSYTSVSTLVRMITGFISNKVVAVIIGPAGLALVGQLSNLSYIAFLLSTAGINNGVVKYVSEYKHDVTEVKKYIRTAISIIIYCSILTGLLLIFFPNQISGYLFNSTKYASIIIIFGITIILYSLNATFIAIINGFKHFDEVIKLNITQSINSLLFSVLLVFLFGVYGALLSLVTKQSVILIFSFYRIKKSPWFSWSIFRPKIDTEIARKFFKYTMMGLTVVATDPVSKIIVRNHVINNLSVESAGLWEGMTRLSNMYLMFFLRTLGIYYLPRLAEIKQTRELRKEVFSTAKIILPLVLIAAFVIYLARDFIINLIFSDKFVNMRILFMPQLLGDIFQVMGTLLATILMAKAKTLLYILTVTAYFGLFTILSIIFITYFQIVGVTYAYALNNFIFLIYYIILFRKIIFMKKE
ncbi:MAG: O-antigen translocase [Promethearchaeota archaeon]